MTIIEGSAWKLVAVDGCPAFYTDRPPCWFHRFMQRWLLGFKWTKEKV
jgi:hypothetical protein